MQYGNEGHALVFVKGSEVSYHTAQHICARQNLILPPVVDHDATLALFKKARSFFPLPTHEGILTL